MRAVLLLVMVIGVLSAPMARAQVVNIEQKRFDDDTSRVKVRAGLRFGVLENTQRVMDLGIDGGVQYREGPHTAFLITDLVFSRVEDNAFQNTGFVHLRYTHHVDCPLLLEGFTQVQYNKPLRIDLRTLSGTGPRVQVLDRDEVGVVTGLSIMYEHEEDLVNGIIQDNARASWYLSASVKVEPTLVFTGVVYYQPVVFDASDNRVAVEVQARMRATRHFAFDSRLSLLRDTRLSPGIPELTYRWTNVFTVLF